MSGPYDLSDQYLAIAIREIQEMRGEFERLFTKLDENDCHACGAPNQGPTCYSCKQAYKRGEE